MPFSGLPEAVRPRDPIEAYEVQRAVLEQLSLRQGPLAGWKIGCTTDVMQRFLGIQTPCAGRMLTGTVQESPGTIHSDAYLRLGVECEIAVRLRSDIPYQSYPINAERVRSAVGAYMVAIELVEDRYTDYSALDTPTLIADNFFAMGCVLGPPVDARLVANPAGAVATMTVNGIEVGRGIGTNVMGRPLKALEWLARSPAVLGRGLRANDVVLLGSLVETYWVGTGDEVVVVNDLLGEARVSFD